MEVRIAGVNIQVNKHAEVALTAIYGIGRSLARGICQRANVKKDSTIKSLADNEIEALRSEVAKLTTEGELRRKVAMDIKRKIDIGSYAGMRHRRGLPLKGRTRSNARTRKGKTRQIVRKEAAPAAK